MVAGMEATAKAQFAEVKTAFEGLEIALRQPNKITRELQSPSPLPISQRERGQWK
jgi:hypothetical protein